MSGAPPSPLDDELPGRVAQVPMHDPLIQSKTHLHADGSPLQFMTSTPSDHESRHIALFHSLPRFWITIPTFNGLGKADFQFHGCSHHLQ